MNQLLRQLRRDERGVLTFEWILLLTLLAIGIVGGLSVARDAIVSELGDIGAAIVAIDQSYTGFGSSFVDTPGKVTTCRSQNASPAGNGQSTDETQ